MYHIQTQKSVSRSRFSSPSVTRANGTSAPHIINFFVNSKTKKLGGEGLLCLFVVYCSPMSLSGGVGQRYSLIFVETGHRLGLT